MAEERGPKIRVTLKALQVLDKKEVMKARGEFIFKTRVSSRSGETKETRIPEEGMYYITNQPGHNRLKIDRVIFEGDPGDELTVEITGEEQDQVSANDALTTYRRVFSGSPADWVGLYGPGNDEPGDDPEKMADWRLWYRIETV